MTPKISAEIRQAIDDKKGAPVYVVDAERHKSYVIIPADIYERMRGLFGEDDMTPEDFLPTVIEAQRNTFDAPGMEQYDDYDLHRRSA